MEEQESTSEPSRKSDENNNPILQDEFTAAVVHWLRHWWDAPREKAKWTDVALVLLTITIAIAAFWSAYVFVGQLTLVQIRFRFVEQKRLSTW